MLLSLCNSVTDMFLHGLDPHHGLWDVVEAVAASRDTTFSKLKLGSYWMLVRNVDSFYIDLASEVKLTSCNRGSFLLTPSPRPSPKSTKSTTNITTQARFASDILTCSYINSQSFMENRTLSFDRLSVLR